MRKRRAALANVVVALFGLLSLANCDEDQSLLGSTPGRSAQAEPTPWCPQGDPDCRDLTLINLWPPTASPSYVNKLCIGVGPPGSRQYHLVNNAYEVELPFRFNMNVFDISSLTIHAVRDRSGQDAATLCAAPQCTAAQGTWDRAYVEREAFVDAQDSRRKLKTPLTREAATTLELALDLRKGGAEAGAIVSTYKDTPRSCRLGGEPAQRDTANCRVAVDACDDISLSGVAQPGISELTAWVLGGTCEQKVGAVDGGDPTTLTLQPARRSTRGDMAPSPCEEPRVHARFQLRPYSVLVKKVGAGDGTIRVTRTENGAEIPVDAVPPGEPSRAVSALVGTRLLVTASPTATSELVKIEGCDPLPPPRTRPDQCELVIRPSNPDIVVTFKTQDKRLELSVAGGGEVSAPGIAPCRTRTCNAIYPINTRVLLDARPDPGNDLRWSDDARLCAVNQRQCVIDMNSDRKVTAVFSPQPTVRVSVQGPGSVTGPGISCSSNGGACQTQAPTQSDITLQATVPANHEVSWVVNGSFFNQPAITLRMNGDQSVSARFTPVTRWLTVVVSQGGTTGVVNTLGISCPNGNCRVGRPHGTRVDLVAARQRACDGVTWGVGDRVAGCGPNNTTCTIDLLSDRTINVSFTGAPAGRPFCFEAPTTRPRYMEQVTVNPDLQYHECDQRAAFWPGMTTMTRNWTQVIDAANQDLVHQCGLVTGTSRWEVNDPVRMGTCWLSFQAGARHTLSGFGRTLPPGQYRFLFRGEVVGPFAGRASFIIRNESGGVLSTFKVEDLVNGRPLPTANSLLLSGQYYLALYVTVPLGCLRLSPAVLWESATLPNAVHRLNYIAIEPT